MTRMADPERPRNDLEDDEPFEDEGRRSIFSALWFRAILVVVVLGVVAAVAVPYVLELANQPPSKPTIGARPETPAPAPVGPAPASDESDGADRRRRPGRRVLRPGRRLQESRVGQAARDASA